MFKRISFVLLTLAVFLTACGPATPTPLSAADVQGTAIAAAFTMLAATQQAIPTATPLPPTPVPSPTPMPTFTPVPLIPTIAIAASPTTAASSGDCLHPLDVGAAGFLKRVRLENTNNSKVTLSLNLWKPNSFGECGNLTYYLKKNETMIIQIPAGNWYAYAWVESPPSTAPGEFFLGDSRTTDLNRLVIKQDVIGFVGP